MSSGVDITGMDTVFAAIDQVTAEQAQRIDQAVQGAGIDTEADTKKAAPVKTGRLRSSYHYKRTGLCECEVGTNLNYAPPVELGHVTRSGSFVAARPHLFPAFAKNSQKLLAELQQIMES